MADTQLTADGFFWMRDGVLSPEFCQDLIAKFEKHPNIGPGRTLSGYRSNTKLSTDLMLSGCPEFTMEDQTLCLSLQLNSRDYLAQIKHCPWRGPFGDTGYNMQRTKPGEYFNWHTDFFADPWANFIRVYTFIWYLTDVTGDGGYTEFANGLIIQPKAGRLLFFPAEFSNMHRGVSPETDTKYIVTGWMHQPIHPEFTPMPSPLK